MVSQRGVEANLDKNQAILEIKPPEERQGSTEPKRKSYSPQQVRLTGNGQMLAIL